MRKLKVGDVVYPTVPVKAYDKDGILPAGTAVTVQNPSVSTVSRFYETVRRKGRDHKHYVNPPNFVLVTFQLDGIVTRGAVYRDQLWLKPVPEIVAKRFPATRMGADMAVDYYRNMMSLSKHLNRLRHPHIVKVVKPLLEGEVYITQDPDEASNIIVPVNTFGMVVATSESVAEINFPDLDHSYYLRYDQIKRVL